MTLVALFCIAEEAKKSLSKLLATSSDSYRFFLVESPDCPTDKNDLKTSLAPDEPFETTFIGASTEACQDWILDNQDSKTFLEPNIIAIADARTAEDGTIVVQWYSGNQVADEDDIDDDVSYNVIFGETPPKPNSWPEWRIRPEGAARIVAALNGMDPQVSYPTYFGRREELTDEKGVFDVDKADRVMTGKDKDTAEA